MDLNLRKHVALVTGGASGIGRATAAAFAAEGADVALWDLSDNTADVARQLADQFGVRAIGLKVDVTDEAAVAAALRSTRESLGSVDHFVHSAAIGSGKFGFPFTNLRPADWPRVLQVNVMGMVQVAHALAPQMVERRSGTMA